MNRADAIRQIVNRHPGAAIIFCNGLTSREASFVADRPGNFYLLHGMGEALSVGIGLLPPFPSCLWWSSTVTVMRRWVSQPGTSCPSTVFTTTS